MKGFIKNTIGFSLIGFIPMLILTSCYFYLDPFKVLKSYSDYSFSNVLPNRDFVSTEMFLKNNQKQHYNSFVFGSSRTIAYRPKSWASHLPQNAKPFMFDASGETVYGIYTKLKFLDSLHIEINNALIVVCRDVTFASNLLYQGHLFIKDPRIIGKDNFAFQLYFFKTYLNPNFLYAYYNYLIFKKFEPYMLGYIEPNKIAFDKTNNQITIKNIEDEISQNNINYYKKRGAIFYKRNGQTIDHEVKIKPKHLFMLNEIKRILEKNKTNYRVVLSPLYDQVKFTKIDFLVLKKLFGTNLYDFTGKNSLTDIRTNYYEISHYRQNVGDSIFKIIYPNNLQPKKSKI